MKPEKTKSAELRVLPINLPDVDRSWGLATDLVSRAAMCTTGPPTSGGGIDQEFDGDGGF